MKIDESEVGIFNGWFLLEDEFSRPKIVKINFFKNRICHFYSEFDAESEYVIEKII